MALIPSPTASGTAVQIELLRVFDDGPVTYELYRMRVPAGLAQTSPAHHDGVTEHVTVFAGDLRTGPLDSPLLAGPGEHVEWPADVPHGSDRYRRTMRAHLNCVENLPLFPRPPAPPPCVAAPAPSRPARSSRRAAATP